MRPGDSVAVLGLGPVGLCAVQVARRAPAPAPVIAIDTRRRRGSRWRGASAPIAVHLTEQNPRDGGPRGDRAAAASTSRSTPSGIPTRSTLAIRLTRKAGTVVAIGVYAERCQVHMGLVWIKALTLHGGQANVIGHVDRVLGCSRPARSTRPRS